MYIRIVLLYCLLLILAVTAFGCGRRGIGLPTASVSGKVIYQDKPLGFGRIAFIHSSGQAAGAELAPDGAFTLTAYQGANSISIECLDCDAPGSRIKRMRGMEINGAPANKSLIPERYANHGTSGLTFEVKETDNEAEFVLKD